MKSRKQNQLMSPAASPPSDSEQSLKEADRFLPIANVSRIMKRSLPANAKISKEAKEAVQACVSEFISFVTGEASDKCQREKRKTVNGEDLLWAMTTLGFENYVSPLNLYLSRYREAEGGGDHKGGGGAATGSGGRLGDHQSPVEDLRHEPRAGFSSGFDVSPGVYGAAPAAAAATAPPVASLGLGIGGGGGGAGGGGLMGYGVQPMMGGGGGDVNGGGGGGWGLPNHAHGVQWY